MVRLTDLHPEDRSNLTGKRLPRFDPPAYVPAPPLRASRIALVTTAGLHVRGDRVFDMSSIEYRAIGRETAGGDIVMSHTSVNFDRAGFVEDVNVVFPIDRFREMEASRAVGSMADVHYSFMGAYLEPADYAPSARELATLLRGDGVDSVFLTPV